MAGVCRQRSLTHRRIPQPLRVSLGKGSAAGYTRGKTILAWPGALMRFPPSARGGMMMRWWRRRERVEATYAREFRSGTSERTGVTFRLKGKGEFENV